MEIGIIGKGKMGRDIFNEFFQFDYNMVMICRKSEDIEEITASIEKQLKKMLKRGYITESTYEKKTNSFIISNDLSALKNCDLVIESVYEDKKLKQDVFEKVEAIVRQDCILASNTSSIPLQIVFEKCIKKDRCMGMHFFYPVKVMRTVEINKTSSTGKDYVEMVRSVLTNIGKNPFELEENANMVLTKMLSILTTQAYRIYEEHYLTIEEIDKLLKEQLLSLGLFEIVDSTGISIILESIENFVNDRYRKLFIPLYNKGKKLIEESYPGGIGNKGLSAYEQEHPVEFKKVSEAELNDYKRNIILRLQSLLINEIAFIIHNQNVEKDKINEAVKEVLGLSEDPASMLKRIGHQKIIECLLDNRQRLQDDIYQPLDLAVFNN
ncbi:MAG: mmgB [Clostridia bacterium]|jgi:3-hydroxybutyryl-CoA dehydrogenase|uniref:3-hydroxyacyl-CoA dehydrogenase family protein n=1 Tax=Petroclostridium xylanilyticum TaxID=1792311 RepID=UPI000B99CFC4|nr:3-hydroxyacyl-CoA dehydrogenase family protein [Petroclostridium xylanilyticum]MBZ4646030.1 mmgB [Clostridia bacterium]